MKLMKNVVEESLDYLEQTLKPDCDEITIEVINRIRKIFIINEEQRTRKIALLNRLPMTNCIVNKKMELTYNLIHLKNEYGYWVLKKIKELFPEASFPIDLDTEYNTNNGVIAYFFEHLILLNEFLEIKDIISFNSQIIVIDSENKLHCGMWENFVLVDSLFDKNFMKNINQALSAYNVDQRINVKTGEFSTYDGAKVYVSRKLKNEFYKMAPIDYFDILVISDFGIKNLQVNKMGYVRENKNLDLLSQKDRLKNINRSRQRKK